MVKGKGRNISTMSQRCINVSLNGIESTFKFKPRSKLHPRRQVSVLGGVLVRTSIFVTRTNSVLCTEGDIEWA